MTESLPSWRPTPLLRVSAAVHAAAIAGTVVAPRSWPLATAALITNHVVLAGACVLPRSRVLGPNIRRLPPSAASLGQVALTIDDGPDPEVTPRVLDLLARHGATASFFLIGRRAERYPEWVTEIVRSGHQVENHTYDHANLFALRDPWKQARDIDRGQRVLTEITGRAPRYFRPPAGIRGPLLDALLHRRGLALVSWTRRGFDTVDGDATRVAGRLTRELASGDILLLHDGNAARDGAGEPVTFAVLPRILEALDDRDLRGVALPRAASAPARTVD